LIERLIGKGFDIRIYDEYVNIARLVGANRDYILDHVPHIARIMVENIEEVLVESDIIVIGNGSAEFRDIVSRLGPHQQVIDLVGIAKPKDPTKQYAGIGW
jgi:GDP-mannose 6-dehydrogenase